MRARVTGLHEPAGLGDAWTNQCDEALAAGNLPAEGIEEYASRYANRFYVGPTRVEGELARERGLPEDGALWYWSRELCWRRLCVMEISVPAPVDVPRWQVRARYTEDSITVYQAYSPSIGLPAARDGRFPAVWKRTRMTWIKPSFLWMMYRCGWAEKENQEVVLSLEISRGGFEWALRRACLSHYVPVLHGSPAAWRDALRLAPARVQWDPERDLELRALPYRSLQLGLGPEIAGRFADEWIISIDDVTARARDIRDLIQHGRREEAAALLPDERPFPACGGLSHLIP